MLSINLIAKIAKAARFDQLIEELSAVGPAFSLALRIRLANAPAAAVALGLRRVLELTAGPTAAAHALLLQLLAMQLPDGSFDRDPIATAAAATAIETAIAQKAVSPADHAALRDARCHALAALAGMQDAAGLLHGPLDRTGDDRALTTAFTLWLSTGDEGVRSAVRLADLLTWLESNQHRLDDATDRFWQLAQVELEPAASPRHAAAYAEAQAYDEEADYTRRDEQAGRDQQPEHAGRRRDAKARFELMLATAA